MMRFGAAALAAAVVLAGCSKKDSNPAAPVGTCIGSTITLTAFQVTTVAAADAGCVSMPADGSTYLVVPQFASGSGPTSHIGYEIGSGPPATRDVLPLVSGPNASVVRAAGLMAPPRGVRERFDFSLRAQERELHAAAKARSGPAPKAAIVAVGPPTLGSQRIFWVCTDLNCAVFKKDTAVAQYVGARIAIYVSQNAPAGGFTPSDITALGNTFDLDLYPIDTVAFGAPSDIDLNQRVIVLLSPKVNAITPTNVCNTQGYVAGYFYGLDLEPSFANSNAGEVFYSIVPDPTGIFSCVHSVASVGNTVLSTFIHEFQHMISWNQHVIVRPVPGTPEETWLNEGLSHVAEELGSLYYENKYPPPTGRTDPTQLFPDSSQGFIGGDLFNSYGYLYYPDSVSVTLFKNGGSLEERGAAWLFLRWLADQKGSAIFGQLDQTSLVGTVNVATQAGESFESLFGDFAMAVYGDSVPGFPRTSAPARDRYVSRNLRTIYNRIYTTTQGTPNPLPHPFPLGTWTLPVAGKKASTLAIGSMTYWQVTMPSSGSEMRLYFAGSGGTSFPAGYAAQLTVFHCPAGGCP